MKQNRRKFLTRLTLASTVPFISLPMLQPHSSTQTPPVKRPKMLLFDVNETLLDLSSMESAFNKAFGSEYAFKQWFSLMLQYSLVDNVTGHYHDFGAIGKAALQMTSEQMQQEVPEDTGKKLLEMIKRLPAHPDVKQGLTTLKEAGFRMATLTNSTKKVADEQLQQAGIASLFEASLSIDEFKVYKPGLDAYKKAISKLGVQAGETMLIAAHGWDVAGATHAGLQTAFIDRKGKSLYPLAPAPAFIGKTLPEIARQLVNL